MTNKLTTTQVVPDQTPQIWIMPPTWLRFLVIIVLVLGVFFRFANLDGKVYHHDEASTSVRISGYTQPEVEQLFQGQLLTVADVQKYQHPTPEKTLADTVQILAQRPEHPPLYYLTAWFWARTFGSSVTAIRSLSAVISLFTFPCIYWLCLELFRSPLTGWIAIALTSVSSFHVLYAQEARQYSLWTVTTLLASATLLRSLRLNTKSSWGLYGITLALGFYSNLLFGLVAVAHGVYVIGTSKEYKGKTVLAYLGTSALAFLTFTPWLVTVFVNLARMKRMVRPEERNIPDLAKWWVRNLNNLFFDFHPSLEPFDPLRFDDPFLAPFVLLLVGYALYFLYQKTSRKVWLFVFGLMALSAFPLLAVDLIQGGGRSTAVRYLIPFFLGIQLAVAFLLSANLGGLSRSRTQQQLWRLGLIVLLSGGVASCTISLPAKAWWNKFMDYYHPAIARIINQSPHPLVVSDVDSQGGVLSLSHLLDPKVRLQLVRQPEKLNIASGFSDIFLYESSEGLRRNLELTKGYKFELVFEGYKCELWQFHDSER